MKNFFSSLLLVLCLLPLAAFADGDKRISRGEYIDIWKDVAVRNMVEHGIPASITLAQGILESADGNSELAAKYNNHFGIKCHSDWKGKKTYHDDDKRGECFRHYKSAKQLIELVEKHNLTAYDKEGKKLLKEGKVWEDDVLAENLETPEKQETPKPENNSDFETVEGDLASNTSIVLNPQRYIKLSDNKIKYVLAYAGETPQQLAKRMELMPWQIVKYNDISKDYSFSNNEKVYIQPKKGRAKTKVHIVAEGESLRDISQQFGVKIKKLLKLNGLAKGSLVPPAGTKLKLR